VSLLRYDCQHDGIFNLSSKTLFTYEFMFDYWHGVTVSTRSFHAHWRTMKENHVHSGTMGLLLSRPVVRLALQSFMGLLDMPDEGFACPCCSHVSPEERTIICYGKCLGFRKDLAFTGIKPPSSSSPPVPDL
jgi:CxC4 like cysteine cluster associated with KDZ transposases